MVNVCRGLGCNNMTESEFCSQECANKRFQGVSAPIVTGSGVAGVIEPPKFNALKSPRLLSQTLNNVAFFLWGLSTGLCLGLLAGLTLF